MTTTAIQETVRETIDSNLLIVCGAVFKHYEKDELIFREGQHPHFYHQLHEGKIKMFNSSDEGKEFIQGFFKAGQSFGEPPVFSGEEYPAFAVAVEPSVVIRLHIDRFRQLLKENFEIHYHFTQVLAKRIIAKTNNLKEISFHNPEHRILTILNSQKRETLMQDPSVKKVKIELTRQEIADMSGLRVETVIRTLRHLHETHTVTIEKGKVFY